MPRQKKEDDERRNKKKKHLTGAILLFCIMVFLFAFGTFVGFIAGIQYSARQYVEVMRVVFENSDVKMTVNMTLNQTQMMDYMWGKINNSMTKKEYVPPCNPTQDIPKGETNRCVQQQVIDEPVYTYCQKPLYKDGYYYCSVDDINSIPIKKAK